MKVYIARKLLSCELSMIEIFEERAMAEQQLFSWVGQRFLDYLMDYQLSENPELPKEILSSVREDIEKGRIIVDENGELSRIIFSADDNIDREDYHIIETEIETEVE